MAWLQSRAVLLQSKTGVQASPLHQYVRSPYRATNSIKGVGIRRAVAQWELAGQRLPTLAQDLPSTLSIHSYCPSLRHGETLGVCLFSLVLSTLEKIVALPCLVL